MELNTHLNFNGNCREAFEFYEKALGAKRLMMMTWGESPMGKDMPPAMAKKVMHATIEVAGQRVMGADAPPDKFEKAQGFAVCLNVNDPKEADRLFGALSEKGQVQMPIQETFWAKRFGMVVDRFGTPWMVNCGKERR